MQQIIFSKAIMLHFSLSILCPYSPHCLRINLAQLHACTMTVIPHIWKCSVIKSISTFAFSAMNFTLKYLSEAFMLTKQFSNLSHTEIEISGFLSSFLALAICSISSFYHFLSQTLLILTVCLLNCHCFECIMYMTQSATEHTGCEGGGNRERSD